MVQRMMIRHWLGFLCVVVGGAGCGPEADGPPHWPDVTRVWAQSPELGGLLEQAVESWNSAGAGVVLVIDTEGSPVRFEHEVIDPETGEYLCGSAWIPGPVLIARDIREHCAGFLSVLMHELGHLLGIGHQPFGLMARKASNVTVIDGPARAALCERFICDHE